MFDIQKMYQKLDATKKTFVRNEKAFRFPAGNTDIVLLQGWNPNDRETFFREYGAHFIKQNGKVVAFYPCDAIINNAPCPICQAITSARSMTNDDEVLKNLREASSNRSFLVNAIVLKSDNPNPQVVEFSKTAFEQLIESISAWGAKVFDTQSPMVLRITRSGTGFDTKYMVTVTPDQFNLPAGTMDNLVNLDDYVDQASDKLLNKAKMALTASVPALATATLAAPATTHAPRLVGNNGTIATPEPEVETFDAPWEGTSMAQATQAVQAQPAQPQPVQPQPVHQPMNAQPVQVVQPAPQPASDPVNIDSDIDSLIGRLLDV